MGGTTRICLRGFPGPAKMLKIPGWVVQIWFPQWRVLFGVSLATRGTDGVPCLLAPRGSAKGFGKASGSLEGCSCGAREAEGGVRGRQELLEGL